MTLSTAAMAVMAGSWLIFASVFIAAHFRERKNRTDEPARSDPYSMWGLILQALAYFMIFFGGWYMRNVPPTAAISAMILMPASVGFAAAAVRHLGAQWRVQAVVTRRHKLVQSGPYSFLRHPIYTSMFGLLIGTGLTLWRWQALLVAAVVFAIGTEIRVRAEDGLLEDRFGPDFRAYRRSVRAWIPLIR